PIPPRGPPLPTPHRDRLLLRPRRLPGPLLLRLNLPRSLLQRRPAFPARVPLAVQFLRPRTTNRAAPLRRRCRDPHSRPALRSPSRRRSPATSPTSCHRHAPPNPPDR